MLKPGLLAFGDLRAGDRFEDLDGEPNETWIKVDHKRLLAEYWEGGFAASLQTGQLNRYTNDVVVRRRDEHT